MTVLAGRNVSTPQMLAAGSPSKELALVVLAQRGTRLAELEPPEVSDESLVAIWRGVGRLHEAGIAHGRLNLDSVRLDGTEPLFTDFEAASSGASVEWINADTAELLLTMAERFGVART